MSRRPGQYRSRQALRLAAAAAALAACAATAAPAGEAVSSADLQAAAQTLQFLESLPRSGALNVGVVYGADRAAASEAARSFGALPAPNATHFDVTPIAATELPRYTGHLDLLLLLPGTSADAAAIAEAVRTRHVASISSDPQCLETHCCVLMVRSGERMDIVLDTALADAAQARFSMVFTMMVKRK